MFDLVTRQTRWVQSRAGRLGIANATVDPADEVTVVTRSPNAMLSRTLEHYRSDGTLAWVRTWPMASSDEAENSFVAALAADSQGNVSVMVTDWNRAGRLYRVSRDGETLFASTYEWQLYDSFASVGLPGAQLLTMRSGAIVHSPTTVLDVQPGDSINLITVISADGKLCKRHAWRHRYQRSSARFAVQGDRLYFSTAQGFGRLELPADFEP